MSATNFSPLPLHYNLLDGKRHFRAGSSGWGGVGWACYDSLALTGAVGEPTYFTHELSQATNPKMSGSHHEWLETTDLHIGTFLQCILGKEHSTEIFSAFQRRGS